MTTSTGRYLMKQAEGKSGKAETESSRENQVGGGCRSVGGLLARTAKQDDRLGV